MQFLRALPQLTGEQVSRGLGAAQPARRRIQRRCRLVPILRLGRNNPARLPGHRGTRSAVGRARHQGHQLLPTAGMSRPASACGSVAPLHLQALALRNSLLWGRAMPGPCPAGAAMNSGSASGIKRPPAGHGPVPQSLPLPFDPRSAILLVECRLETLPIGWSSCREPSTC
jgi:hypothetical protein